MSDDPDKPPEPPKSESDGTPEPVSGFESAPVTSGKMTGVVAVASATEATRTKRLTDAAKHAIDEGVQAIGSGIGSIGEGVQKLGEKSKRVPIVGSVGSSVAKLGEGITHVGESLTELPRVARTRRGRLLVRSLLVGFSLVAAWITIIVAVQIRGTDSPDFRPIAEDILVQLSRGKPGFDELYEHASPRFQEVVRKERFVDEMSDMLRTVGAFREITAVNDSLVTSGPTGRVGRVGLTVAFEKGTCKTSVSFHWYDGAWLFLGVGVELPPELRPTMAEREDRVKPSTCREDPMDKKCELKILANDILEQLRDGKAPDVWQHASPVFQQQEEKARFAQIQSEHGIVLGPYRRIIAVTEAIEIDNGTKATFDALTEYANALAVRVVFGFERPTTSSPWQLRSFKRVLPMPRLDDPKVLPGMPAVAVPPRAGSGSGSGSAGSGSARSGSAR